jgi:hypothetical protein
MKIFQISIGKIVLEILSRLMMFMEIGFGIFDL